MKLRNVFIIISFLVLSLVNRCHATRLDDELTKEKLEMMRQLDEHYHKSVQRDTSDRHSTPFKRITRLFHALIHKKMHKTMRTHVAIHNKTIDANGNDRSREAHLVIESDSFGTIKIHSVEVPMYYLCIGKDGKPVGVPQSKLKEINIKNCIFKEQFKQQYVLFKSLSHYDEYKNVGCLAFNRQGRGRRIQRSKCGHRSTLFIERGSTIIIDVHNDGTLSSKLISLLRKDYR